MEDAHWTVSVERIMLHLWLGLWEVRGKSSGSPMQNRKMASITVSTGPLHALGLGFGLCIYTYRRQTTNAVLPPRHGRHTNSSSSQNNNNNNICFLSCLFPIFLVSQSPPLPGTVSSRLTEVAPRVFYVIINAKCIDAVDAFMTYQWTPPIVLTPPMTYIR